MFAKSEYIAIFTSCNKPILISSGKSLNHNILQIPLTQFFNVFLTCAKSARQNQSPIIEVKEKKEENQKKLPQNY